jgi:hypothetical protein
MAKKHNKISGQFSARLIEMMESPAFRVLSLSAHRALSRIEIELAHHGGQDNGQLPVTFDDFERYGLHRHAIGPALAELEALGFIVITEKGKMARAADYRRPNKFLLTSRPVNKGADQLHKWKRFKTMEEAEAVAEASRKASGEKKKPPVRKPHREPVRKTYHSGQIASAEAAPLATAETAPLSISRVDTPHVGGGNATTSLPTPPNTPTRPSLPLTSAVNAQTSADGLLPNAPANIVTARPRLAWARPDVRGIWSRPVVRELTGVEAISRRDEIDDADFTPQAAAMMRPTVH